MISEDEDIITPRQAVIGIINGMIGAVALYLPTLVRDTGDMAVTIGIILVSGLAIAFSSWIYSMHLGDEPDNGHSLNKHFNVKFWAKFSYDLFAWLSIVCLCIEYFQSIIMIQYLVLEYYDHKSSYYCVSSAVNGMALLAFVLILKHTKYGAKIMVYGIVIVNFFTFIFYLLISSVNYKGTVVSYFISGFFCIFQLKQKQASRLWKRNQPLISKILIHKLLVQLQICLRRSWSKSFLYLFSKKSKTNSNKEKILQNILQLVIQQEGQYTYISQQLGIVPFRIETTAFFHRGSGFQLTLQIMQPSKHSVSFMFCTSTVSFHSTSSSAKESLWKIYKNVSLNSPLNDFFNLKRFYRKCISAVTASVNEAEMIIPLMILNGGVLACLVTFIIPIVLHIYCMNFLPVSRRQPFSTNGSSNSAKKSEKNEVSSGHLTDNLSPCYGNNLIEEQIEQSKFLMQNYYCECRCQHYKKSKTFKALITLSLIGFTVFGISVSVQSIYNNLNPKESSC